MKIRLLLPLVLFFVIVIANQALAMAPPPPPPPAAGGPQVPIDGGISLLILAGAGYGAKKIYDSRKKNKSNSEE
jgi:hypothetical protein